MTSITSSKSRASWIIDFTPLRHPRVRLLCLPYAGGGANVYRGWADALPPWIGVAAVQLPGREGRLAEPPMTEAGPLIERLVEATTPLAEKGPLALFGHSMGAVLAWELARAMRRRGSSEPGHLFVAGRRAPDLPSALPPLHGLPDAAFRAELARLGGTPREVLTHDELMNLILPMLRADFTLIETWRPEAGPPLSCPLTTFAGIHDAEAAPSRMAGWTAVTRGPTSHRVLPGGHFFLQESRAALLSLIAAALEDG